MLLQNKTIALYFWWLSCENIKKYYLWISLCTI